MTCYQRAKRIAFWRGSALTLFLCTAWMLASAFAGKVTQ
ncbi:hypothetical protein SAMN05216487_3239 [Pseudomonas sp. UC 17F4]|nr:hypothetical protein SAMN05216487_3239 [Pseudomonas sp. UC 17F4]